LNLNEEIDEVFPDEFSAAKKIVENVIQEEEEENEEQEELVIKIRSLKGE